MLHLTSALHSWAESYSLQNRSCNRTTAVINTAIVKAFKVQRDISDSTLFVLASYGTFGHEYFRTIVKKLPTANLYWSAAWSTPMHYHCGVAVYLPETYARRYSHSDNKPRVRR